MRGGGRCVFVRVVKSASIRDFRFKIRIRYCNNKEKRIVTSVE